MPTSSAPFLTLRRDGGYFDPDTAHFMDFRRAQLSRGERVILMRCWRVEPDGSTTNGIGDVYDTETFDQCVNFWTSGGWQVA